MSNQTYIQHESRESSWVARVLDDNKKAKCKVCRKSFELFNMGRGALTSHQTKSEKQKHPMKNLSAFLVKSKPKSSADNRRQNSVSSKSNDVSGETDKKISRKQLLKLL